MKLKNTVMFCLSLACIIFLLLMASCSGEQQSQSQQLTQAPANVQPLVKQVEAGQEKRRTLEAQYKAMPIPELANKLEADSTKDIEPFNSLAYREVVTRGANAGQALSSLIKAPNRSAFLALIAVRELNRDAYGSLDAKLRTAILIDALRTSKSFNTWGLPHLYWEKPAKAIIELGQIAVEPLKGLLRDTRPAPVWGSEEAMEYQKYKYRLCDYAWALLMQIEGKKVEIPTDPVARDRLIAAPTSDSPK